VLGNAERKRSACLHELLKPHVEELVVPMPGKSKGLKDDVSDACARAEELRIGAIWRRVYRRGST
jgi:hypothetical protein